MRGFGIFNLVLYVLVANSTEAQVVTYTGDAFPENAGWQRVGEMDSTRWLEGGKLHQHSELGVWPGPMGQSDIYTRSLAEFDGAERFFVEWVCESSIPEYVITEHFTVPTNLVIASSSSGVIHHTTPTETMVQIISDIDLPYEYVPITPGPHKYRVEVTPGSYRWLIDDVEVHSGIPVGPFPVADARINFGSGYHFEENLVTWDYIRFGIMPGEPIPAVSSWAMAILALLLVTVGSLIFFRPARPHLQ